MFICFSIYSCKMGSYRNPTFFVLPSSLFFCFVLIWFILVLERKQSKISILRFSSKMSIDGNLNKMSKENICFRLILKSDLSSQKKIIKLFLLHIKIYTQKINKRFAQESKNKAEYPNIHFILCLNIDAYNSFVIYWN